MVEGKKQIATFLSERVRFNVTVAMVDNYIRQKRNPLPVRWWCGRVGLDPQDPAVSAWIASHQRRRTHRRAASQAA